MMTKIRSLFPLGLLFIAFTSACSSPEGRYQSAVIADGTERPCFRVADSVEARESSPLISVIDLYERQAGVEQSIWMQRYLSSEGALRGVSPEDCLPQDVPTSNPFPRLSAGKRYSVDLVATIETKSGDSERRFYSGHFCMIEAEGKLRVHQVLFDGRRQVWAWDTCGAAIRSE